MRNEVSHEQTKTVRWKENIMVTYSKMCHEGVGKTGRVVRRVTYDTRDKRADEVVMWKGMGIVT